MRAATHTEVYRPFLGELRKRPKRALTLAWSGIRIGFRKKLPLLLLFLIPAISTIVTAFMVQLKFEAESGTLAGLAGEQSEVRARAMGMMLSNQLGEVSTLILELLVRLQVFVVLTMGWYGAGLIAEDKRLRANLLYFARPLTRWTYILGKLGTVCFWGSMAVVTPVTVVIGVAVFASPDWAYLTERWPTILRLEAFAILWVFVHGMLVLAISSLVDKRNHAMAGLFGFYFLTSIGAVALTLLFDDSSWFLVSIPQNLQRISDAMFETSTFGLDWPVEASLWVLGFVVATSGVILARQVKKMEVGS